MNGFPTDKHNTTSKNAAFFPFNFPCDIALARGKLKHSHLENGYINLPPSCLSDAISSNEGISHQEALELYEYIVKGLSNEFSPALLIDLLSPFQDIDIRDRTRIKAALQTEYEEQFRPQDKKTLLSKVGEEFFTALNEYLNTRKNQPNVEPDDSTYISLKAAATKLRDILDTLPKGIWLP